MYSILFWLFLINAVLLITHEIDSAYWKEWELFKLPGGVTGFLLLHLPLVGLLLYGFYVVSRHTTAGLVISLIVSAGGIFAFAIHRFYIKKGKPEFKTPVSLFLLAATLVISLIQAAVTLWIIIT